MPFGTFLKGVVGLLGGGVFLFVAVQSSLLLPRNSGVDCRALRSASAEARSDKPSPP